MARGVGRPWGQSVAEKMGGEGVLVGEWMVDVGGWGRRRGGGGEGVGMGLETRGMEWEGRGKKGGLMWEYFGGGGKLLREELTPGGRDLFGVGVYVAGFEDFEEELERSGGLV